MRICVGVSHARWNAGYDIRIDMQNPTQLAKVVYKASISQATGEVSLKKMPIFVTPPGPTDGMPLQIWENAPITLETTNPTFGLDIPVLPAWNLNLGYPVQVRSKSIGGMGGVKRHRKILPDEDDLDYVEHQVAQITSTGSVNATFRIPGRTTIPSDDDEHSVTIADLKLDAKVTWVCIPKADTRVHLEVSSEFKILHSIFSVSCSYPQANIKNSSNYASLSGISDVYVDQSFIARSDIPNVSPQATFHCPLG